MLPGGYLADVYDEMRQEGAVCIADEVRLVTTCIHCCGQKASVAKQHDQHQLWWMSVQVQTGFGRAGSAFWAFETQVSLIVTQQRA